jgi:hypothetical protein
MDETYVGGKPSSNSDKHGRGTDKTPVVGVKERTTGSVYAEVAEKNADSKALSGSQLYTILSRAASKNIIVMTDYFR